MESSGDSRRQGHYIASIIIPVYNRAGYTLACLESLSRHTGRQDFEVIMVDNASTDGTAELLAGLSGDVTVISNPVNLGFAKACNQGAAAAQGRYLVFLNNDTKVTDGWLDSLIAGLDLRPGVAVVGAKLLYPNGGGIQHAGVVFNPKGEPYHIFRNLSPDHFAVNQVEQYQAVTAACMLIRREAFAQAGGFDEGFINGFEDVDLCLKVGQAGHRVLYTPHSVVYHYESLSPGRSRHTVENHRRFLARWGGRVLADENRYLAKIGIRLEYDQAGNGSIVRLEAEGDSFTERHMERAMDGPPKSCECEFA